MYTLVYLLNILFGLIILITESTLWYTVVRNSSTMAPRGQRGAGDSLPVRVGRRGASLPVRRRLPTRPALPYPYG